MSAAGAAFAGGPAHPAPHGPNAAADAEVCHKPGTKAEKTMLVGGNALVAHLAHGDDPGAC